MDSSLFKKITYAVVALAVLSVIYLAFIKDNSATSKNADFLGLKNIPTEKDISNKSDLTIDGVETKDKTEKAEDQAKSVQKSTQDKSGFYVVKEGDTYGCISETYYGSYEHWTDILNANVRYGNGYYERELHIGATLEMPEIQKENLKPASKLCS